MKQETAMDFWREKNWHAVQTKPHREELVAASLDKLNIEVFLPKVRREHFLFGQQYLRVGPLFRAYLFASFCPVVSLETVRHARGVLRVLGDKHGPIPVPPEIIPEMRSRLDADGFIRLDPPALRPGQRVAIEQGPFEGLMGRVEQERDDGRRVAILLETIIMARVLIEKKWLVSVAGV